MKRRTILIIATVFLLAAGLLTWYFILSGTGVPVGQDHSGQNTSDPNGSAPSQQQSGQPSASPGQTTPDPTEKPSSIPKEAELLQSAAVDLDSDGKQEIVEAFQVGKTGAQEEGNSEIEGWLRVTGSDRVDEVMFIKKHSGLTGVMSGMDFKDLDSDGVKDVFMIIPDAGAAFSLNYFYLYNYKTGQTYSYAVDSNLADFCSQFSFTYIGNGKLEISNANYGFHANFNLDDREEEPFREENGPLYERAWVEPTPVEIGENSRLELVDASDGKVEIKVPLPVFGQATADMIGEIDLYYRVEAGSFQPVMQHFEVKDFNRNGIEKIGGSQIR